MVRHSLLETLLLFVFTGETLFFLVCTYLSDAGGADGLLVELAEHLGEVRHAQLVGHGAPHHFNGLRGHCVLQGAQLLAPHLAEHVEPRGELPVLDVEPLELRNKPHHAIRVPLIQRGPVQRSSRLVRRRQQAVLGLYQPVVRHHRQRLAVKLVRAVHAGALGVAQRAHIQCAPTGSGRGHAAAAEQQSPEHDASPLLPPLPQEGFARLAAPPAAAASAASQGKFQFPPHRGNGSSGCSREGRREEEGRRGQRRDGVRVPQGCARRFDGAACGQGRQENSPREGKPPSSER